MAPLSMVPTPGHCLLSQSAPTASQGALYDQLTEGEKTGQIYRFMVLHDRQAVSEGGQLQQCRPLWDVPEEPGDGKSSQGELEAAHQVVHFAQEEEWPDLWLYTHLWAVARG